MKMPSIFPEDGESIYVICHDLYYEPTCSGQPGAILPRQLGKEIANLLVIGSPFRTLAGVTGFAEIGLLGI